MWAARVWWMLRAFGFENAAVLNGGWKKWTLEGRPVATDDGARPPRTFVARPRPELIADKKAVLAGVGDRATCLVNALSEEQHRGTGGVTYGRAGRIAGSTNVVARDLVDPKTHAYLPADALRAKFAAAGALDAGRVITYCGGGIAASSDAFVLALLGKDDVAVYDASLSEWAADPSLPMETG
jgi:thiosulfate/3-mercaptopyruvate sulfurtransferase